MQSSLCALAVWNGVGGDISFLIYSYQLTISKGFSLVTLDSKELTQCSGSFKWGEGDNWEGDNHQFICTGISLYIPIS